ncbi:MAG: hypothetical protein CL724_10135 [Chloroflexi bacterium]|jgi:hypothetical protein|nr:hypothetical protein [Chloroflexota bacterium]|tara:strand:+ start:216 stop:398 length:183 start_codon:yes stop_codon:yes gene_type:complete
MGSLKVLVDLVEVGPRVARNYSGLTAHAAAGSRRRREVCLRRPEIGDASTDTVVEVVEFV